MKVQVRCDVGHHFLRTISAVDFREYRLLPLPTAAVGKQECVLEFDVDKEDGRANYARGEAKLFLSFASLLFDCEIKDTGCRVDGVDQHRKQRVGDSTLKYKNYDVPVSSLSRLSETLAKQFVRSSKAYQLALHARTIDYSLAFLLLVTAIEAMSSQEEVIPHNELDKTKKSCERFCNFVTTYCSNLSQLYGHDGEDGFKRNLKTVYYEHRSAFVHAGKQVSYAADLADQFGFKYITHTVDGKPHTTPGLHWFFNVVRKTLLGFLQKSCKDSSPQTQNVFAQMAADAYNIAPVESVQAG
jgi:hypothetical protein